MKLIQPRTPRSFQLMMIVSERRNYCYWCGQKLKNCDTCHGKGEAGNSKCTLCSGSGMICPTHEANWD